MFVECMNKSAIIVNCFEDEVWDLKKNKKQKD